MTDESTYDPIADVLPPVRKVLVPTDFSEPSQKALLHALRLAHKTKACLQIIHVSETLAAPPGCPAQEYLQNQALHRNRVQIEILGLVAKLWSHPFEGHLEPLAVEGVPSHEIVRVAQENDVDLIVISTHGHTGFKRFFLGSTADKVVRFAPCSVLVVKGKLQGPVLPPGE